jgi:hypothetical protein
MSAALRRRGIDVFAAAPPKIGMMKPKTIASP